MPMSELDSTVDLLGPRERGQALAALAAMVSGKNHFVPTYWLRDEYTDWLRLYGRRVLQRHYAESDKRFTLIVPDDEESQTIWDYFHQPLNRPVAPWFVMHRAYNLNHRGLLLRRNWEQYHLIFKDIYRPPVEYVPLIPGIRPNTWIVDDIPQELVPLNTQPRPWKDPKI